LLTKKKYTTIPVLVEVKEKLNSLRGATEWSKFLLDLVEENRRLKRIIAAREIQERFCDAIEHGVKESIRLMRKLSLREEH